MVVCLSNNSVSKEGYIQQEIKFALDIALEKPEGMIFVVPLRLENCELPRRLRSWQYVDYFPVEQRERAIQKLFQSLKVHYSQLNEDKHLERVAKAVPVASSIKEDKTHPPSAGPTRLTEAKSSSPIAQFDVGGTALLIFFFVLAVLFGLGETGDEVIFSLGWAAILSAVYLFIRRQIISDLSTKITIILFTAAYGLLLYARNAGWV